LRSGYSAHEWGGQDAVFEASDEKVYRDAAGNVLVDGDHDIDCKIDGFGAMKLKSEFVRKAS
jgi:protein PhnA